MSMINIPTQEGLMKKLPPRQKKAYRERFRYWLQKGLPPDEAHARAARPILSLVQSDSNAPTLSREINFSAEAENLQQVSAPQKQVPVAAKTDLPADDRRQKQKQKQKQKQRQTDRTGLPAPVRSFLPSLPVLILAFVVTSILIHASIDILGADLTGIAKAISLEAGILFLSLSPCRSWFEKIAKRSIFPRIA